MVLFASCDINSRRFVQVQQLSWASVCSNELSGGGKGTDDSLLQTVASVWGKKQSNWKSWKKSWGKKLKKIPTEKVEKSDPRLVRNCIPAAQPRNYVPAVLRCPALNSHGSPADLLWLTNVPQHTSQQCLFLSRWMADFIPNLLPAKQLE